MTFKPIASGSSGNAYLVDDGHSRILLECGINYKDIQVALDFKMTDLSGCLITHEHKDHCKALKSVLGAGIDCYMSRGTKGKIGEDHHRLMVAESKKQFNLGTFSILPFDVNHDASEPLGYLIQSDVTKEKLLFATDTYYIKYRFNDLSIIAVECNYSESILNENIIAGVTHPYLRKRVMGSHFSLENYLDFLRANDLSKVREVWLLHLSNNNSDEKLFKSRVERLTGVPTYIA